MKPPKKPTAKRARKSAKLGALSSFIEKASPEIERADQDKDKQAKARKTAAGKKAKKPPAATRLNKKGLIFYVDPKVTRALRRLALDTERSVQELGMTALNMLFRSHGLAEFPFIERAGEKDAKA